VSSEPDSLVRCSKCQREERVSFAVCLGSGWPKCHGYTMTLVETKADVGAATTSVLRSQSSRV
jgi:hypothetical protein